MRTSIHRPHTRPDVLSTMRTLSPTLFQFTGLIRGPTFNRVLAVIQAVRFNSQASYEARLLVFSAAYHVLDVSIHRPHTRPDCLYARSGSQLHMFQFTGLIRGPTMVAGNRPPGFGSFNSQASYEARLAGTGHINIIIDVSIHKPHTRPDAVFLPGALADTVSIHRPHTRPDSFPNSRRRCSRCFNSQASYEARPGFLRRGDAVRHVSIHRPHTRPDSWCHPRHLLQNRFNSQASYEARLSCINTQLSGIMFQFTGLIRGPTL